MQLATQEHSPAGLVLFGKDVATSLMQVVEQTHAYEDIQGKRYLRLEAWQFIGMADGVTPTPEYLQPIYEGDEVVAYEAKVNLLKDGIIVGSGIMECGMDEFVTRGRTGRSKHSAAKSMAQTRATSKAFRLKYSWVATMAGFQPTTAEEMQGDAGNDYQDSRPSSPADKSAYFCEEHQREWFKRGNMKSYAHPPLEDGGPWCQMRSADMPPGVPHPGKKPEPQNRKAEFVNAAINQLGMTKETILETLGMTEEQFKAMPIASLGDRWKQLVDAQIPIEEPPVGALLDDDELLEQQMQEPVPAGQVEEPSDGLPRS